MLFYRLYTLSLSIIDILTEILLNKARGHTRTTLPTTLKERAPVMQGLFCAHDF